MKRVLTILLSLALDLDMAPAFTAYAAGDARVADSVKAAE